MAPIFSETDVSRSVYLPGPARWTHGWTGVEYDATTEGITMDFDAPLGQPPVFYRSSLAECDMSAIFVPYQTD